MTCNRLLWIFSLIFVIGVSSENLETVYQWKYLSLTPVPAQYRVEGEIFFNYEKAVPFDVDVSSGKLQILIFNEYKKWLFHHFSLLINVFLCVDGRVFMTVIAKPDVRVSLVTISNTTTDNGPMLDPYPDPTWYSNNTDCTKIINSWSITVRQALYPSIL